MLFFPTVDEDVQYFRSQGYTGSINDMHFKAMGDLGYTGSLNDRIHSYLTFKYGSYYEAMRNLRNGTSVFSLISAYAVNGFDPALVFDFVGNYFRKGSEDSTLAAATTYTGASNGTMTDGYGAELVTNGSFDTDVSGWSVLFGSVSWLSGKLHLVEDGGDGSTARAYQGVATEIGKTYIITADVGAVSLGNASIVASTSTNTGGFPVVSSSGNETVELVFVAAATTTNVLLNVSGSSARTADFDNISVREMPVIKWKPHNLLTYSEDFYNNAAWGKVNSSVSANVTTAPDGTTTADKLIAGTSLTQHRLDQPPTSAAGDQTLSVYVKDAGYGFAWIRIGSAGARFSIADGTTTSISTGVTASSQDVGSGWRLLSISHSASANAIVRINVIQAQAGGDFVGDGTSGIYVWGAHLYRSDLGGMVNNPSQPAGLETYVPTTSAAVYLPRVGNHVYNGSAWVNEGLLLESEARTNLMPYSEDFTQWGNSATTITGGQFNSLTGLSNATLIETTGGINKISRATSTAIPANTQYTYSVMAKAGTVSWLLMFDNGFNNSGSWFDLGSGALGTLQSSATSAEITDLGDGWYQCSVTAQATATRTTNFVIEAVSQNNDTGAVNGENLYIYGAQVEAGSTPSSYIPTAGATVTRAAETLTVAAANMPWPTVVETTGTELVTNGTFDTDSVWYKGVGWTISGGVADHDEATGGGILYQDVSVTAGLVYRVTYVMASEPVSGGGSANTSIQLFDGPETTLLWGVWMSGASGVYSQFNGSLTYTTTVAPTTSTLRLRSYSDDAVQIGSVSVKEINPLSVSIQMDGRMTYADTGGAYYQYLWQLDGANRVRGYVNTFGTYVGRQTIAQEVGNVEDQTATAGDYYSPSINVPFNIAARHGSTFINGAVDGTALTANTTPTALPDLSATDFQIGSNFMGNLGKLRVWADDLGDTGIAEATLPSTEPSLSLTFDGSENSFTVLDWSE